MSEEDVIKSISNLPFETFSCRDFLKSVEDMNSKFVQLGNTLISDLNLIDTKFNQKEIQKIISNSSNSDMLVKNLEPYLNSFNSFSSNFFNRIEEFFKLLEENEATLSGFKYRFLADSIMIFEKVNSCELYLLDENDSDLKKVGKQITDFLQRINQSLNEDKTLISSSDQEVIKSQNTKAKKSIFRFLIPNKNNLSLLGKAYSSFIADIKRRKEEQKSYSEFDRIRTLIIQEIDSKKIQLSFIKKLDEYFIYLDRVEVIISSLEKDILNVLSNLNKYLIDLNQRIFNFINYILNEKSISEDIKEKVRNYLENVKKVEEGIKSFSTIENNLSENVSKLGELLNARYAFFVEQIRKNREKNNDNSQGVLEERLAA